MNISRPQIVPGNVIATLHNCDGVYECPMAEDGSARGPLVGYAGQYADADEKLKNYVGFVYYNVAKGDQWAHIANHWAESHASRLKGLSPNVLVAAPMGGISYMSVVKQVLGCRGIFVEKKVTEAAADGKREKSKLILGRYDIVPGDRVILVEDIVNNFSTTKQMVELVENAGGIVVAIACVINRSDKEMYWEAPDGDPLPVVSLAHKPTPQYRQDDPAVARYIAEGNIVWKPKDKWDELMVAEAA